MAMASSEIQALMGKIASTQSTAIFQDRIWDCFKRRVKKSRLPWNERLKIIPKSSQNHPLNISNKSFTSTISLLRLLNQWASPAIFPSQAPSVSKLHGYCEFQCWVLWVVPWVVLRPWSDPSDPWSLAVKATAIQRGIKGVGSCEKIPIETQHSHCVQDPFEKNMAWWKVPPEM